MTPLTNQNMKNRKLRLSKIKDAELSVTESLLKMRSGKVCFVTTEDDEAFKKLYYLSALARKAK